MNIYLCSRYGRIAEVDRCSVRLMALGHVITSRWHVGNHKMFDNARDPIEIEANIRFALNDLGDLNRARVVIAWTEQGDVTGGTRGGRHFEAGFAYAAGKRLLLVGRRENVFHYLPDVEAFDTENDLLANLGTVRRCRECGCTEERGCPGGCTWTETALCSECDPVSGLYGDVRPLRLIVPPHSQH